MDEDEIKIILDPEPIQLDSLAILFDELATYNFYDDHDMQIIEELVYLCINEDFVFDVNLIRSTIQRWYPKFLIPTDSMDSTKIVRNFIAQNHSDAYRKRIEKLIKKYKLIPSLYWHDHFRFTPFKVKEYISERGMSKERAQFMAYEDAEFTFLPPILDNIIIQNTVYDEREGPPYWLNSNFTRKQHSGKLSIEIEKDSAETVLKVSFPPYCNLKEMQRLLQTNYKEIQKEREKELPVPARKDSRKQALPKALDAYIMQRKGMKLSEIAVRLDEKYSDDLTFEAINKLIKRLVQESSRFDQTRKM